MEEECEHNQPFWECEICGNVRVKKKNRKKEFKTYEQMATDKLKEIEPATRKQWASVMRDTSYNSLQTIARRCVKLNLVTVNKKKQPYIYSVNKEV